jgi:hypothetical protein
MNNQTARTLYAHKIRYGITGAPMLTEDEMEGSHAPGIRVAPALIELVYSAPRDGKPASVSASVTGPWTRFGERADGQMAVHFKNGPEGWPVWLAEEARLHDPDAAVCICGHTEAQHFEDACLACDCGDYLVPEAAREVIARWRDAATGKTADRATVLRQSVNDPQQADDAALESAPPGCWYDAEAAEAAMWAESMAPAAVSAGQAPATDRAVLPAPVDQAAVLREPTDDDVERLGQWLWDNCAEDERTGLLSDDPRRIAAVALRWPELRRMADEAQPDECPQCGDIGACNGGPCPLGPVVEAQPAQFQTGEAISIPPQSSTQAADESPHVYMTAIRHQAGWAHDFLKAGRLVEAMEHVEAIEQLAAVTRRAVAGKGVEGGE